MNSLGNSGYDRIDRDHYPTPGVNVGALLVGLQRAGIAMPRRVLDPCGGDGAISCTLGPLGFDVRLTDLHPGEYRAAREFYATTEPRDARSLSDLWRSVVRTQAQAIVTNPPYSVSTHGAIVKACLTLLHEGEIELLALMHLANHLTTLGGHATTTPEPRFALQVNCCWRTILFDGPATGKQSHAWRVWTREPRRRALTPHPCIGVTLSEARAEIKTADITPSQEENSESCPSI